MEEYRLDDALFALQSLIEYANSGHLLSVDLRKRDWTLADCMRVAREYREYAA